MPPAESAPAPRAAAAAAAVAGGAGPPAASRCLGPSRHWQLRVGFGARRPGGQWDISKVGTVTVTVLRFERLGLGT